LTKIAIFSQQLAIFVNGVHTPFTVRYPVNNFPNGGTPADMYEFSADFMAVGGLVDIEFRFSGSGTGRTVLSIDDTFITGTVPEPHTSALLGLALAGLAWRRRAA